MSIFDNLIRRLHRAFDKEHEAVPVITLSGTGYEVKTTVTEVTIKGASISQVVQIADDTTLQALVDAINATGLVTATLDNPDYAGRSAKGLLNDTASVDPTGVMLYPTSLLWHEMSMYGRMLDEQAGRIRTAEQQLYLHSSGEDWLEYWLTYLDGTRKDYEDDAAFRARAVNDILALNQNNTALGNLIRKAITGLDCTVADMPLAQSGALYYAGAEHYTGAQTYSGALVNQYGRFEVQTQIELENSSPLADVIAKISDIVERHKSAGTKMESIKFQAQTTDTATISETRRTHAALPVSDVLPWGIRYDGSILHDNADGRLFDGTLAYNGLDDWDGWANIRAKYNNAWETDAKAAHLTATDQQAAQIYYNGLADFDGFEDFGATLDPVKDGRTTTSIKRHYLYDGKRTYGSAKSFNGNWGYNGSLAFDGDSTYCGIHEIPTTFVPPPDCSISGDVIEAIDAHAFTAHTGNTTDRNRVVRNYDGLALYDATTAFDAEAGAVADGVMPIIVKRHDLYDGRYAYGTKKTFNGDGKYDATLLYGTVINYQGIHTTQEVRA